MEKKEKAYVQYVDERRTDSTLRGSVRGVESTAGGPAHEQRRAGSQCAGQMSGEAAAKILKSTCVSDAMGQDERSGCSAMTWARGKYFWLHG